MLEGDLQSTEQHDSHVQTFDETCADDELDLVCDLILSNLSTNGSRIPYDVLSVG